MLRNRDRAGFGMLLLTYQLFVVGFDQIPPVTLVTILAQAAIFLGLIPDLDPARRAHSLCLRPDRIWFRKEWWRLFPSTFMHADDMHLYFNMVSFLWKGRRLERKFGSLYFAYLLGVFTAAVSGVMVAGSVFLEEYMQYRQFHLMHQCAIGFSGVIFALKVMCNHYFPHEDTWVMGWFLVPSRLACWAELLIIQLLVPNASFIGHLSGILVGLAYCCGPLKSIMNSILQPEDELYEYRTRQERYQEGAGQRLGGGSSSGTSRFYGSGTWGSSGGNYGTFQDGYSQYTGGLSEEEQMRRAMDESLDSRPSASHMSFNMTRSVTRCNYPWFNPGDGKIELREQCGRYKSWDDIPSFWWQICTVTVGVGSAAALLVAFVSIPACCIQDVISRTSARVLGIIQALAAIFIAGGCVIYPLGWGNREVKDACGDRAGPYLVGSCSIGWAYYLVLGGAILLLICSSLSTKAGKPVTWHKLRNSTITDEQSALKSIDI